MRLLKGPLNVFWWLFSFHIKILFHSSSWANAAQSSLSLCEWRTTCLRWDQKSKEHLPSEQQTLASWCCRGRGWSTSCPLCTALLLPHHYNGVYLSPQRGKPSHVQARHLLYRLPLLGTKHRAAQHWGSYAAHPGGFAAVLATVDPSATRDREQVPPLSELLQLSLKQGGCMGMWAGTWASRLCQVCCLSVPRGEEVSAGWAGRWWVSSCENWDEVSLLLWGSFYLEMHVSMHLKIS